MKEFVGIIVKRDGKFLVLREVSRPQYWNFPGGAVEPRDSEGLNSPSSKGPDEPCLRAVFRELNPYHHAVSRELYEETGLTAKIIEYAYDREVHVDGIDWVGHYYRVMVDGEASIREPTKCLEMEWVTEEELSQLPCREGLLDR